MAEEVGRFESIRRDVIRRGGGELSPEEMQELQARMQMLREKIDFSEAILPGVGGTIGRIGVFGKAGFKGMKKLPSYQRVWREEYLKALRGTPKVPTFRSTEEALQFGKKYADSPEVLDMLRAAKKESLAKSGEILKMPRASRDVKEALKEAFRGQFFREALEAAEGTFPGKIGVKGKIAGAKKAAAERWYQRHPELGGGPEETFGAAKKIGVKGAMEIFETSQTLDALKKFYNKPGSPSASIIHMSPDEYISKVSKGMGFSKRFMTKQRPNLDYYREQIRKGEKLEMPGLDYGPGGKMVDQDGMHRVMAAKELGIEKIPVFTVHHKKVIGTGGF